MPMRYLFPLLLVTPAFGQSMVIEPVDPQLGRAVDFYQDVFPVLEAKCLACHNVKDHEGSLVLENVQSILKGGDSGAAVVAGNPNDSLLVRLAARSDEPVMPPLPNTAQAKPVTPRELGILRQWIQEGAQAGNPPPQSSLGWLPVPSHLRSIQALAMSPNQQYVAAGRANRVVLFDLAARREVASLTDPALLSIQHNGQPMYGPGESHRDFVHAVAFSPDGKYLASAGYREVKLWEYSTGNTVSQWDAGQPVTALSVSADGSLAATGHADGSTRLWNLATGQPGPTMTGHTAAVTAVAFQTDGATLLTGSNDKTLRRWNVADGAATGKIDVPTEITALLVSKDGTLIVSAQQDNRLLVWDPAVLNPPPVAEPDPNAPAPDPNAPAPVVEPPKPTREIGGHGAPVTQMLLLAADSDEFLTASRDGNVRLINIQNGGQVRGYGLGSPVLSVAVSGDRERIAAVAENGTGRIWQRDNGQQLAEVKGDPALAGRVLALTEELTVARAKVGLRDTEKQEAEKDVTGREESVKKAMEQKDAAVKAQEEAQKKLDEETAKATEAARLAAEKPEDEGLRKAKEEAEKVQKEAQAKLDQAKAAVESADRAIRLSQEALERAKQLVTTTQAAHMAAQQYVMQIEEQQKQAQEASNQSLTPLRAVAFSADGGEIVTAGDAARLDSWNSRSGGFHRTQPADGPTSFLGLTSNGLLVSTTGTRIIVRDTRPVWNIVARLGAKGDSPLDVSESPMVDRVLSLAFSPDSTRLATGGGEPSRGGEIVLWDVASRSVIRKFAEPHSDAVFDLEFSRDGRRLVSGAADKFVKLFDVDAGTLVRAFEGHTNHVLGVSISSDESSLLSGGADNAVKHWNVATGEQRRTMNNFTKQVTSVDYIGVTDNFVSSGGDKTVRLFTASNGNNFRNFSLPDFVYDSVASRDQNIIVGAGEDGTVFVWNGQNGQELTRFPPPALDTEQATAAN